MLARNLFLIILSFFIISCQHLKSFLTREPKILGGEQFESLNQESSYGSDTGDIQGLSTIFFGLDSSKLNEATKKTLKENIKWFRANTSVKKLELEGHCDPLGSEAYNIGLGRRRAEQVKNFLKKQGVSADKLEVISFGEEKPLSTSDNSKNRRVNFVPIY